ncbi:hypothetical protein L4D15_23795 [Enterovibrio norvegicus]|uniref:hypothetical protein n=1 Tax=Enterovibrio norvegicus TaxID=188144 RepID=UPI003D14C826
MKIKTVLWAALAISATTSAAEWTAAVGTGSIEVHESGVYFSNSTPIVTSIPCKNYNYVKFSSEKSKLADQALSIGLSASMANKKVRFYLSHCDGSYLVADSIMLPQQ